MVMPDFTLHQSGSFVILYAMNPEAELVAKLMVAPDSTPFNGGWAFLPRRLSLVLQKVQTAMAGCVVLVWSSSQELEARRMEAVA